MVDGRGILYESDESVTFSTDELRALRDEFQRFLLEYQFGLREVETKLEILRDEFQLTHDYNPIEHVTSRVKTPDSIVEKVGRKGIEPDFESLRAHITDIAGVRVTCSFVHDAYRLFDLLTQQDDIRLRAVKDYIAEPKENGYKSLHAIVEVPVFLSTGRVSVPVEVQFRTIAMDFWASLVNQLRIGITLNPPFDALELLGTQTGTGIVACDTANICGWGPEMPATEGQLASMHIEGDRTGKLAIIVRDYAVPGRVEP